MSKFYRSCKIIGVILVANIGLEFDSSAFAAGESGAIFDNANDVETACRNMRVKINDREKNTTQLVRPQSEICVKILTELNYRSVREHNHWTFRQYGEAKAAPATLSGFNEQAGQACKQITRASKIHVGNGGEYFCMWSSAKQPIADDELKQIVGLALESVLKHLTPKYGYDLSRDPEFLEFSRIVSNFTNTISAERSSNLSKFEHLSEYCWFKVSQNVRPFCRVNVSWVMLSGVGTVEVGSVSGRLSYHIEDLSFANSPAETLRVFGGVVPLRH